MLMLSNLKLGLLMKFDIETIPTGASENSRVRHKWSGCIYLAIVDRSRRWF